jgi:hypothetical protein
MELKPSDWRYQRAKRQVREIRAFYIHLACYLLVIPIIIAINLTYMPEYHWFWFSMGGWGLGLFFHAMEAFGWTPLLGKHWEERKIQEEMQKGKDKNQPS